MTAWEAVDVGVTELERSCPEVLRRPHFASSDARLDLYDRYYGVNYRGNELVATTASVVASCATGFASLFSASHFSLCW